MPVSNIMGLPYNKLAAYFLIKEPFLQVKKQLILEVHGTRV